MPFSFKKTNMVYCLFLIVASAALNLSYVDGSTSDRSGSPANNYRTCSSCHSGGTGGGAVNLTGAPTTYTLGQTYALTLTVTDADMVNAGFMLAAVDESAAPTYSYVGTFTPGIGSRLVNTVGITHDNAKAASGGQVSWTFDWTAPSSGSGSVKFYFAGNAVDGLLDEENDDVYLNSVGSIFLPIQITDFKANPKGKNVDLTWATAAEKGGSHFEIERKSNTNQFSKIGTVNVQAVGKNSAYQFEDNLWGVTADVLYYRLKMIDIDGKFTYSPIKTVQIGEKQLAHIYPTQNTSGGTLTIEQANAQVQTAHFYDISGRLSKTVTLNEGKNSVVLDLPRGQYLVQVGIKTTTIFIQ